MSEPGGGRAESVLTAATDVDDGAERPAGLALLQRRFDPRHVPVSPLRLRALCRFSAMSQLGIEALLFE